MPCTSANIFSEWEAACQEKEYPSFVYGWKCIWTGLFSNDVGTREYQYWREVWQNTETPLDRSSRYDKVVRMMATGSAAMGGDAGPR